jgi:hypothetical protein
VRGEHPHALAAPAADRDIAVRIRSGPGNRARPAAGPDDPG